MSRDIRRNPPRLAATPTRPYANYCNRLCGVVVINNRTTGRATCWPERLRETIDLVVEDVEAEL